MGWGWGTPKTAQPLCEGPLDLCWRANKGEREGRGGRREGRKGGRRGKERGGRGKGKKWRRALGHRQMCMLPCTVPRLATLMPFNMQMCGVGSLGELTVRGVQTSRGETLRILERADLTAL